MKIEDNGPYVIGTIQDATANQQQEDVRLVGTRNGVCELYDKLRFVAPTEARVLITGETGTGKSVAARALHVLHPQRRLYNFRRTNVGALAADLAASQLFGHEKGAFTGAERKVEGIIVEADKGTLFLDEISTAAEQVQVMLLTLLETKTVNPIGASKNATRPIVDVRVISASNERLHELVDIKRFRQDLLYRIAEWHIEMPPLRERAEEIPALAQYFLDTAQRELGGENRTRLREIARGGLRKLHGHTWPGNVRELEHVVRAAVIRSWSKRETTILEDDCIQFVMEHERHRNIMPFDQKLQWKDAREAFETQWAKRAEEVAGSRKRAAEMFNIDPKTLHRMLGPCKKGT